MAENYALRVIVSKPLVGEYHIQHEKVATFSRGKRYLEQEVHKKKNTTFKCNLKLFLNALDRGKNRIGCWVEKKSIYYTSKYFTAGMNIVPEHAVHRFDIENARVPLFVFIARNDMIPHGFQLRASSIPNNVDFLTKCFQLIVVGTEHVLLPGTIYFFFTPSHCQYMFNIQNYEWPPLHYPQIASTAAAAATTMMPSCQSVQQQMDIMMRDIVEFGGEEDQQQMEESTTFPAVREQQMESDDLVPSDFVEIQMDDPPVHHHLPATTSGVKMEEKLSLQQQQQYMKIVIDPELPDKLFASEPSSPATSGVKIEEEPSSPIQLCDQLSVQQKQQQMEQVSKPVILTFDSEFSELFSIQQQQQQQMEKKPVVKVENCSSSSNSSEYLAVTSDNELFPEVSVENTLISSKDLLTTTSSSSVDEIMKDFNSYYNSVFMCDKSTMTEYCIFDDNESVHDQIRQLELQLHALYDESKKIKSC